MPAIFFILGSVMLFMFVYIASKTGLGPAKPLLSFAYVGLWLYCMFEAIMMWRGSRIKRPRSDEVQRDYSRTLKGRRSLMEEPYEDRLRRPVQQRRR